MIRTKIEYGTHSWAPVRGCKHGLNVCPTAETCWARGIATRFHKSFEPTFHPEVLQQPLGLRHPEGSRILVCFTGDLGGAWVPQAWQKAVVDIIRQCPIPNFLLLTKNPSWYARFNPWPANAWVGTSITGAETPERQGEMLEALRQVEGAGVRWISYEPALGPLAQPIPGWMDWVVVGAQTGKGAEPFDPRWLEIVELWAGYTAMLRPGGGKRWWKNNLLRLLGGFPLTQELPR